MMGDDPQIDGPKSVVWAHQLKLFVERKVTQMQRSELPERNVTPDRLGILGGVPIGLFKGGAVRIRLSGTRKRCRDVLASRFYDSPLETRDSDLVTGFHDSVLRVGVERRIRHLQKVIRARLYRDSVINKFANGFLGRQFCHAAEVIAMAVGGDEVVDLFETRILDGIEDASGIPARSSACVSGINKDGLSGRGNKQRRIPTLDIDNVNIQSPGCSCLRDNYKHEQKRQE